MSTVTYPPQGPTVNGHQITVDWALKNPTFINKAVSLAVQGKFISDYIFRAGDAAAGAVVYERTLGPNEKYPAKGDVSIVEPGDEFPLVDVGEISKETAIVDKFGAAALVTYEQVRRNQKDKITEAIVKISNAILRKTDSRAMAALAADPDKLTVGAAAPWGTGTPDPFADIVGAVGLGEGQELDYNFDTVLINPTDAAKLLKNRDIRDQLPREAVASNPLLSGRLEGLAGLNWIQTNRKAAGSLYILQRNITGVHAEELATYTRNIDEPINERWRVQGARVSVPIITDPKSLIELTGI
ncbi:major capsid protein [Arthrobacter phage HumptyDumpty]|uniref:Major capsid protein n=8 Tax=Klausavirus princesstrina TaxID=1984784 RepID=A0A286N425_9CAUD|nr:major capsid protein [Arthrobacter phage Conboy]APC44696.1 major capsid protein [Arthrobacter phage EdgarPoe]APC44807.1 major capsid protein [Arthrobacter phage HumptyDumpty]ASX98797.1 major capsid protein [Arthrobacter phage Kabreeze]ASX99020.1 major capsid protein [Arthrobacter phage Scavito]ASX99132.1 major capsid protein [Arthrobacter phage Tophat]QBP30383.1 major capsid protein [Arthrobacter phage Chipper1996]QEQ94118.1 major capsid protein [Arthrobacter phage Mordred]